MLQIRLGLERRVVLEDEARPVERDGGLDLGPFVPLVERRDPYDRRVDSTSIAAWNMRS